ncbi:efflux RND transporter periplasmic adaptor subunit [Ferrimonas lipolytica]|uniref:Efflux RND transporter periplasmic adaptor subunit n=1 Tax=Ferrimonas lipolytica TaxID=2724191 RepID=A0A6H1UBN1_9GAMM|nr:efflux RND transporter periplasmic adaptor subunit [Ferrimonas lipolytica]QIZ75616.1 efflux RND transporter periplasmic adaptor subunit [Ferrimonas lipolytica]
MKLKLLPIAVTIACGVALFSAVAYNGFQMENHQQQRAPKPVVVAPSVAVSVVSADSYTSVVQGYGEALPQYQLTLTAQSSGQVLTLADAFASGNQVKAGQLLAKVEDSNYQQAVSDANKAVADAKLALLEEQRQGDQARKDWQHSGLEGEPDSPLVLRQPQLAAAEATLEQALRQLASAKVDLANTEIRAPFDAVIVSRDIQLGSYLQQGNSVAMLYSTDVAEIRVPLSQVQWQALGQLQLGPEHKVALSSSDGHEQWQGYAARIEQHLNSSDRQRSLVVAVDEPLALASPLHAGTFVTATITGQERSNLWQLPTTAISQDDAIWMVTDAQTIVPQAAEVVFADQSWVYLTPSTVDGTAQIVQRPLNNYLSGMRINAVSDSEQEQQ